ncbi:type VII secretion-associated serine protease mycosin [Streptomyces sp. DSM 41527]|uniref:Type VII secretion-associated serine protease mycosin n=1 Tax=Streptomyces mooreae TaxID=3075523 RepID=A0ABU2THN6_9ACTN|nr:type VII secretion-associated serine protease mycosin [Streptomyces sp. DSM 41527]MDT0460405.1 type VII secretion-associated serine protease mycosin [Streptomyces sp. DSM 41527]
MTFKRWMTATCGTALLCAISSVHLAPPAAADSIRDHQWALSAFDADAIEKVSTGRGVTVAVVDTGVDGTHPDLIGNVLPGKDFLSGGGRADHETDNVHGTAMASLIAGHGHGPGNAAGIKGLAPDAKILPLRVNVDGKLQFGSTKGVAQAIRYAVDHGASVINLSLASPNGAPDLEESVRYAQQKGAVVVAGAGNDGGRKPNYPASFPGVISVGAVDSSGRIWEKSNYGSNNLLAAPGVDNYSAGLNHQYQTESGTSDATAYVSAAAALLRSKFPKLTAGQIANRLVKTAKLPKPMKGTQLPDKRYGYGFIRPYSALTEDIPAGPKNGPLPAPSASSSTATPSPSDSAAPDASASKGRSAYVVWGVAGAAVLGLLTGVAVVVVKRRRPAVPPPSPYSRRASGPDPRQ